MRISDWSSDVCSSDLAVPVRASIAPVSRLRRRRETGCPATAGRTGAPPPRVRRARPLPAFVVRCPVQGRPARLRGGRTGRVAGRRRGGARGGGGRGRSAPWRPAWPTSRPPRLPNLTERPRHRPPPPFPFPAATGRAEGRDGG